MRAFITWMVVCVLAIGCSPRQDPVVRAAQDLQRMAYDFAAEEEARQQGLRALRLGMSDSEVLALAGPPSARESRMLSAEESREVWIYRTAFRPVATLTFVNHRLTQIDIQ
ncbi:MAG: DUF2845 domain-containing protein [Candidatus Binatia bacterium]|nr:DUF2845 domain-containing protein [Candidatus Binatia bacterium]